MKIVFLLQSPHYLFPWSSFFYLFVLLSVVRGYNLPEMTLILGCLVLFKSDTFK
jgi:hypothetical protein